MTAWAFGANWQRLIAQYGREKVDLFLVSKEDIAQELKNAQLMGIRVDLKELIFQRLKEHYGLLVHWPDNSARENS